MSYIVAVAAFAAKKGVTEVFKTINDFLHRPRSKPITQLWLMISICFIWNWSKLAFFQTLKFCFQWLHSFKHPLSARTIELRDHLREGEFPIRPSYNTCLAYSSVWSLCSNKLRRIFGPSLYQLKMAVVILILTTFLWMSCEYTTKVKITIFWHQV